LAGGIKPQGGVIQGFFHELIERQGPLLADCGEQEPTKVDIQCFSILFGQGKGGED
jgi:hypothetical protein